MLKLFRPNSSISSYKTIIAHKFWEDLKIEKALSWEFTKAVFIGDTVHVQVKIIGAKKMARLGGGIVTFNARVLNQNDEVVHKGEWRMLIKSKPE